MSGSSGRMFHLLNNRWPNRAFRSITTKSSSSNDGLEAEYAEARKWAARLNKDTIPKTLAKVRFDRSSGKGGQHVNTTSSKATCTWSLNTILPHVPRLLHQPLRSSRYYAPSSDSLVIQAQTSRKQHDNEAECFDKLYQLLWETSKRVVPGETSSEQHAKVDRLSVAPTISLLSENTAVILYRSVKQGRKQSPPLNFLLNTLDCSAY
ncbi:MAG: hypothetical protein M1818_000662 [Claussenomyces sp. TS43310]|nr:MAG: hypothetical protein M1818_000662 [Claussenomyces sp. TS43310]